MKRTRGMTIPFFAELLISYALIALLLFVSLIPVKNKAVEIARERFLADARSVMEESCDNWHQTLKDIYQVPMKLASNSYYIRLKLLRQAAEEPLPNDYFGCLYMAHKAFLSQVSTIENVEEVFACLPYSGVVLGKERAFLSLEEYQRFDLRLSDDLDARLRAELSGQRQAVVVRPAAMASVHQGESTPCILISFRKATDSTVICAAYTKHDLLNVFNMEHMPEGASLRICDAAGGELFFLDPMQGEGGRVWEIGYTVPLVNLLVTIGVPDSYFVESMAPINRMLAAVQTVALLICAAACVALATWGAGPVRRLARQSGARRKSPYHVKEWETIQTAIDTANGERARLNALLRSVLFVRMMYGALNAEETAQADALLPQTGGAYRVAVIELRAGESQERAMYFFQERLADRLGGGMTSVQLGTAQIAVLLSDEAAQRRLLEEAFRAVGEEMGPGVQAAMGVSDACTGKRNMARALRHAQVCLLGLQSEVGEYAAPDGYIAQQPLSMYGVQLLYKYLVAGQEQSALELFGRIIESYVAQGREISQCLGVAQFVLECAAADSDIPAEKYAPFAPQPQEPIDANIASARQSMTELCALINANRQALLSEKRSDMITYIRENYTSGEMYADAIAEHFGTTRNQVYRTVRAETGMSLNEFVEKLRLERARAYLESTELPVAQISAMLGYNSINTFYKAFKKKYGIAPGSLRG